MKFEAVRIYFLSDVFGLLSYKNLLHWNVTYRLLLSIASGNSSLRSKHFRAVSEQRSKTVRKMARVSGEGVGKNTDYIFSVHKG